MSQLQARRATIDDLPGLRGLWSAHQLPVETLEKRVTEFQLALSGAEILGAVALHVDNHHGKIHSLAISANEHEAQVRKLLWERIQNVAKNTGLVRLWQHAGAPLTADNGFHSAEPTQISQAPAALGLAGNQWLTLKLREDAAAAAISLDKEFAFFAETERLSTERIIEQGKKFRLVAYSFAAVVMAATFLLFFFAFRKQPKLKQLQSKQQTSRPAQTNAPVGQGVITSNP